MAIDEKIDRKYQRSKLKGNEVLLTIVGRVGESAVVPQELKGVNVARAVAVIPVRDDVGSFWVHYCLRTKPIQHLIQTWCNTTVQATLNLADVERIPIPLPPIQTRSTIVHILKTFDNMVNNTSRKNQILEQIIQSIFKSWFVDFDRQTEFVDSELGQVPKGWNVQDIDDLCKEITDGSHTSPKEFPSGTKWIASVKDMRKYDIDISSCKPISDQDYFELVKNGCKPQKGDILFSKDGTMGITHIFNGSDDLVLLSSMAILRPKVSSYFLYCYLSQKNIQEILIGGHSSGSALPRIVLKDLKKLRVLVPESTIIEKFNMLIEPIFNQILQNISITTSLNIMRNSLLLKLISGEIKV